MEEIQDPLAQVLRGGVTLDALKAAVDDSGYLLQTTVAELLADDFVIQPEWGYRDRVTGDMRTIDLLAVRELRIVKSSKSRVRAHLVLILECKQSELPYVFFRDRRSFVPAFPTVCGLRRNRIVVKTDDDRSVWSYSPLQALELDLVPFVVEPPGCSVLARVARRGQTLELTGTDAYQRLVMPLMSAVAHFKKASRPPKTAFWFDAYLVVPVAVLAAPMAAAKVVGDQTELELTKWERLYRHEPHGSRGFSGHLGQLKVIDAVHHEFFSTYLRDHLLPYSQRFGDLALKHNHELATGKAFASGLGRNSANIESRMKPRSVVVGPPARLPPKKRGKL
ncbi:MAG TPA: hypothetical protein VLJ59_17480 [Mycobacteriales bacterium]|nr:hypothetical protein [Mycobacteriales bacterium]